MQTFLPKRSASFAVASIVLLALCGCATKNYGRQGQLTSYEQQNLSCRDIDLESAKVHGFLQQVDRESEFDGRSVLSFLGDFGIGNVMEKSSAVDSANQRLAQLQDLRANKGCGIQTAQTQQQNANTVAPVMVAQASPNAGAPRAFGSDSLAAERFAKGQACTNDPIASLTSKGPGFEIYSVRCANDDTLVVRCEWGNCRSLK